MDRNGQPEGLSGKPADWHPVLGELSGVRIDDAVINNGMVDILTMQSLACGGCEMTPQCKTSSRWPDPAGRSV